jgi:hypothetical protein
MAHLPTPPMAQLINAQTSMPTAKQPGATAEQLGRGAEPREPVEPSEQAGRRLPQAQGSMSLVGCP